MQRLLGGLIVILILSVMACTSITSDLDICILEGPRYPQSEEELARVECQPLPDSVSVGVADSLGL